MDSMDRNIREKIKERPINRKKLLRRTLITAGLAVLFGGVACVTFLLLQPVISGMLYQDEETHTVVFPEEEEELSPEDMAVDDTQLEIRHPGETSADGTASSESSGMNGQAQKGPGGVTGNAASDGSNAAAVENGNAPAEETHGGVAGSSGQVSVSTGENAGVETAGGENPFAQLDSYQQTYSQLWQLCSDMAKSTVTVTAVRSDVSWINSTLEDEGQTRGFLIADNGKELLILTEYEPISEADQLSVTFQSGEIHSAEIIGVDETTGLTILGTPLATVSLATKKDMEYFELGSSAGKRVLGQPVIAMGKPTGSVDSVCYGMITSAGTPLGLVDGNYKLLTTDIYGSTKASGILINMQGQIVGVLYNGAQDTSMPNQLRAIGITDLKKTIERLSNGDGMYYVGVHGMDISAAVRKAYQIPTGGYIKEVDVGSPAMKAGMQSGDIVVAVNEDAVKNYTDFVALMMKKEIGETVSVRVQRETQSGYQEITVEITLGEQN